MESVIKEIQIPVKYACGRKGRHNCGILGRSTSLM